MNSSFDSLPQIHKAAVDLLADYWSNLPERLERPGAPHYEALCASEALYDRASRWILPNLVSFVLEQHHGPVDELRPMIRRQLLELAFVDENGDSTIGQQQLRDVECLTSLMVAVLQQIHQIAIERGQVCDMATPMEMFG